jgi:hypothetical protein
MTENLPHTNKSGDCYYDYINSIAETCDNEYYMWRLSNKLETMPVSLPPPQADQSRLLESLEWEKR